MSANAAAQRLLAAWTSRADAEGCFTLDAPEMAERFAITARAVKGLAARLADGGAIERLDVRGHYRITGQTYRSPSTARFVRDPPQRLRPPRQPVLAGSEKPASNPITAAAPSPDAPCSYRIARALGIEPVIRLITDRTFPLMSSTAMHEVAITLARVPSLERPLPDIGSNREAA